MADPIAAQFGALDKLMKESAEADTRKRVALQRFQLGQMQAQLLAKHEMEQHQAEMEGAQEGQAQQPQAPFQLQLPPNSALAERPVSWKNPLSQIAGNAYSQMAQAGAEGPGAGIQEALRSTAGAIPGGMDAMLQGLGRAGPTQTTTQTDIGVSPQAVGQQGFMMVPTANRRTTETPNGLTQEDIAKLRAGLLDRILAEQGQAARNKAEGPKISPEVFRQTMKDLNDQYGDKVPAQLKSQIAKATAMGDLDTAEQLSSGLPSPKKEVDPLERQAAMAELKDAQKGFEDRDVAIDSLNGLKSTLTAAKDVLERGMAQTGVVRGSKMGALVQRIGASDEQAVNALQQAFASEWLQSVQQMRGVNRDLNQNEGAQLEKLTGGMDKSIKFNLDDLKRRIALVDVQVRRANRNREIAAKTRDGVLKRAGLSRVIPSEAPREEPAPTEPQASPPDVSDDDLINKWAPK